MRPLVVYAFLKSVRERFLWPLLMAPLVFLGAPLLGITVEGLLQHRAAFPARIATMTFEQTSVALLVLCGLLVVAASAAASFWVFRSDLASQSLSFFLFPLRHSAIVCAAAVMFGWTVGMASYALTFPLVVIAVGAVPDGAAASVATVIVGALVSACAGILVASISPRLENLIVMPLIALAVTVVSIDVRGWVAVLAAVLVTLFSVALASHLVEKRCAG